MEILTRNNFMIKTIAIRTAQTKYRYSFLSGLFTTLILSLITLSLLHLLSLSSLPQIV